MFKGGFQIFVAVGFMFSAGGLSAADKSCAALATELKSMQQAQHQLLSSIGQKSTSMAETLDWHANHLNKVIDSQTKVKKADLKLIRSAANAFRQHEVRESDLVERFEKASVQLLDQVQSCLKAPGGVAQSQ